jgi:phospholipid/cholesterol/gamma-HCH transport system permease protein
MSKDREQCSLTSSRSGEGVLCVAFSGSWRITNNPPDIGDVLKEIASRPHPGGVAIDTAGLAGWDSSLLSALLQISAHCAAAGIEVDGKGLPDGMGRLLALATAVPEREGARRGPEHLPLLARVGEQVVGIGRSASEATGFVGEVAVALWRMMCGRARFRRSDLMAAIRECGAEALPIATLISALFGLILAFIGAVQLKLFGAEIYVASLVGISVVRVMGAVMTGVIVAGRTGAAYAAELGTMRVTEEIDAMKTLGISPMEFLVLPRLLALALMMPLLCLYADLMGVLGGFLVGVFMLGFNAMEYWSMTVDSVNITDLWIGLFHAFVFGILIALAGCLKGMKCGRSASAVGTATTSAVVTGIVGIVVATAIITVLCNVIGI